MKHYNFKLRCRAVHLCWTSSLNSSIWWAPGRKTNRGVWLYNHVWLLSSAIAHKGVESHTLTGHPAILFRDILTWFLLQYEPGFPVPSQYLCSRHKVPLSASFFAMKTFIQFWNFSISSAIMMTIKYRQSNSIHTVYNVQVSNNFGC
jgi:hypothetical protein